MGHNGSRQSESEDYRGDHGRTLTDRKRGGWSKKETRRKSTLSETMREGWGKLTKAKDT